MALNLKTSNACFLRADEYESFSIIKSESTAFEFGWCDFANSLQVAHDLNEKTKLCISFKPPDLRYPKVEKRCLFIPDQMG